MRPHGRQAPANHDVSYRRLFFHPRLIRGLLEFIPYQWARQIAPHTLRRVPDSLVSDRLKERRSDMIWRGIRMPSEKPIYLLIEFQSTVNHWMGLRMANYSGMFSEIMVLSKQLREPKKAPPVFPLLLYNGPERWNAPLEASELFDIDTKGLEKHALRLRLHLLEVNRFDPADLEGRKNAFACLLRLENSRTAEDIRKVVGDLIRWFPGPANRTLRQDFATWLVAVLLPHRFPDFEPPENVNDLMEVKSMLAERVDQWTADWEEQGRQKGHRQGHQEGHQEGLQQGLQQGRREGRREAEVEILTQFLNAKIGPLTDLQRRKVLEADAVTRQRWIGRLLSADAINQVIEDFSIQ